MSNIVHAPERCPQQVHEEQFQEVAVAAEQAGTPHSKVGMQPAVKSL
ncbi:MAG: hypothetical protein AB1722_00090 [Pseudomonadota bacterium]